jgi:hypothetical protein
MLSFQMLGNGPAVGETAWLKGKLRYINEAFMTDFSSSDQASAYVKTYEDDATLLKDMPYDAFVELHEKGDACVIIDRFVVIDRNAYMQYRALDAKTGEPYCCLCGAHFAAVASC